MNQDNKMKREIVKRGIAMRLLKEGTMFEKSCRGTRASALPRNAHRTPPGRTFSVSFGETVRGLPGGRNGNDLFRRRSMGDIENSLLLWGVLKGGLQGGELETERFFGNSGRTSPRTPGSKRTKRLQNRIVRTTGSFWLLKGTRLVNRWAACRYVENDY